MNETIEFLLNRKSVRVYEQREIGEEVKERLLAATLRAPTAGNLMLYSIIEVKDQAAKDTLVRTCDNQPLIAKAPLVLLFLADYQRWVDYFRVSGVEELCEVEGKSMRTPEEGDLFLACCDALIAAQTAAVAAESLGLGSCYIGDIMENYEEHRELFDLPQYVFPICLLCFGYPTRQQRERALTRRLDTEYVVFEDRYRRFAPEEHEEMYRDRQTEPVYRQQRPAPGVKNLAQMTYTRKFDSDFAREMNRSVRAMLRVWVGE